MSNPLLHAFELWNDRGDSNSRYLGWEYGRKRGKLNASHLENLLQREQGPS